MIDTDPCEICRTPAITHPNFGSYSVEQTCPRCGRFKLTLSAATILQHRPLEDRIRVSGWVYDRRNDGGVPTVASDTLNVIFAQPIPGLREKTNRLLVAAVELQPELGQSFDFDEPKLLAATYSKTVKDVIQLAEILQGEGLVHMLADDCAVVTGRGRLQIDDAAKPAPNSDTGFVAMWFNPNLHAAYEEGIRVAVASAGYAPIRVDAVEHIDKIDDVILEQIKSARFVVADLTGHRGGVYFEAGYAKALNIPVFWTCRHDDMAGLHFDVRQYNCVSWETVADLQEKLRRRIVTVIGRGPN